MTIKKFAAGALLTGALALPVAALAQESHEDAKAQVDANEAKHHTKAKEIGGGAAGGAVAGAAIAGPAGAVVGAGAGAVTGGVIHHKHKKTKIRHKEETGNPNTPPS
jgi:hypothetical protein